MARNRTVPIVVIGAGPAGSVAAALLKRRGHDVLIVEREQFPRFSIGESLLPQCMAYIEEAGMLRAAVQAGFQHKNGAIVRRQDQEAIFDFREQLPSGWCTAWQVQRDQFDKVLADSAADQGVEIQYRHTVEAIDIDRRKKARKVTLTVRDAEGEPYSIKADMVLDASGFGRVLPRLLDLECPSDFPVRTAVFTHVQDNIPAGDGFDRLKILVDIHPRHKDVWYWLIPFSNGRCSLGVVGRKEFLEGYGTDDAQCLKALVGECGRLRELLQHAVWDTRARHIVGYAANVKSLHGPGFALLGNAGEFLDPVFSSGVTIAMRSASLAARLVDRQLRGKKVSWEKEYSRPMRLGVDVFRVFVRRFYDGSLQDIFFVKRSAPSDISRMITSILAGYAWDETNPFVRQPERGLNSLYQRYVR